MINSSLYSKKKALLGADLVIEKPSLLMKTPPSFYESKLFVKRRVQRVLAHKLNKTTFASKER